MLPLSLISNSISPAFSLNNFNLILRLRHDHVAYDNNIFTWRTRVWLYRLHSFFKPWYSSRLFNHIQAMYLPCAANEKCLKHHASILSYDWLRKSIAAIRKDIRLYYIYMYMWTDKGTTQGVPGVLHKLTALAGMRAGIRCLVSSRPLPLLPPPPSLSIPLKSPTHHVQTHREAIERYLRIHRSLCHYSMTFRILAIAAGKSWKSLEQL